MPLAETRNAIGALAQHLADQLTSRTDVTTVNIGRPEDATRTAGPKLNLFLYEIGHDGYLRNTPLGAGQAPPIWLRLRFLMTAVDEGSRTDSPEALELLGQGLLALRAIDFQRPPQLALADNPEPIKITFEEAGVDLLSAIMQGDDARYRLSAAFEVRPVLLAAVKPAGGAPLIRSIGQPATPGVRVLPSMGPRLDRVLPETFEAGEAIVVEGADLAADQAEICFGNLCFPLAPAQVANSAVRFTVPAPPAADLAAGSHAVTVVKLLPGGRRLSSNAALGRMRPSVTTAATAGLNTAGGATSGTLTLAGRRLGGTKDSIFVAFYANGGVQRLFEAAGTAAQTSLTLVVPVADAVPSGPYRILVQVNGEQALHTPQVAWS